MSITDINLEKLNIKFIEGEMLIDKIILLKLFYFPYTYYSTKRRFTQWYGKTSYVFKVCLFFYSPIINN